MGGGHIPPILGWGWRWNEVLEFVGSRLNRGGGALCVLGDGWGGVNGVCGDNMFLLYFKQDTALAIQF